MVAGGGPAGMAAAVTAARQGRSVLLIESQNCLGGMGTAGLMPIFMTFGDSVNFCAGGFGRELYDRLEAEGGTLPERPWGKWLPLIRGEALKRIYDDMAVKAGVELLLVTQAVGVQAENGRVSHVICAAKSGLFAVGARIFIDCTGDGDLAAWAGAGFEKGDEAGTMMPGTLCSLWADVDWRNATAVDEQGKVLRRVLAEAPDLLPEPDPHLVGMLPVGGGLGGGNIGHAYGVDGTDERSLTRALLACRRAMPAYERFYREHLRGFEKAALAATAALFGVRETRRILGDYVLGFDDYERRASFDDEIGRYHNSVDMHLSRPTQAEYEKHIQRLTGTRYRAGESYGIPYRILTPRGLDNLLVAGRCVSVDRMVLSSLRVMPGCFITGQACGMAAAMAAEAGTGTRAVPIGELQRRLKGMGAFLPNAE